MVARLVNDASSDLHHSQPALLAAPARCCVSCPIGRPVAGGG